MSPTNNKLNAPAMYARMDGRLAAYATLAGITLAAPAIANATVVYSGVINLAVPNNVDGVYINFVSGATGTSAAAVPGANWNAYNGGTNLQFFWNSLGAGLSTNGTTYTALALNAPITSGSTYIALTSSAATLPFRSVSGVNAYLGVRFTNSVTAATNYGWVHLQTGSSTTGFPATIIEYAYDNAGGNILAGQTTDVPEPTTFALLGAMAAGAVGVRNWRKSKAA